MYVVEQLEVTDTLTEEEVAREALLSLREYVRDGIEARELARILKKYYGVAAAYCCDLVVRLKVELDMYLPGSEASVLR